MKKISTLLCAMLFAICSLHAQDTYQIKEAWDFFKLNELQTGGWKTVLGKKNIQGSPYLNDDFIPGVIFTSSKIKYTNVPLRYNIYSDELEYKTTEQEILAVANPEIIERVVFGNITLVYTNYFDLSKPKKGFLQLLVEGDANLYARSEILFREPKEAAAFKEPEPAKFIKKSDSYYISINENTAQKIRSKKEIPQLLPGHQQETVAFIKSHRIRPGNPAKLQQLVSYYNSL